MKKEIVIHPKTLLRRICLSALIMVGAVALLFGQDLVLVGEVKGSDQE